MLFPLTALATLAMIILYVWTMSLVGQARRAHGVKAPATGGPEDFNRVYRAHVNTQEQMVLMIPALWIFAATVGDRWAGLVGVVWLVGRVLYVRAYSADASRRGTGFMIGFFSLAIAVVGSAGTILWSLLRQG
jgi:glutathione S-transferase